MNRLLLIASVVLIATAANAQIKRSESLQTPPRPTLQLMKPEAKIEEMQMRTPGATVFMTPKRDGNINVWYRRPAGAFTSRFVVEDGVFSGMLYAPDLFVKPYTDYTFLGFAEGVSENAEYYWEVNSLGTDEEPSEWVTVDGKDLTWKWGYVTDEVPTFCVIDNDEYCSWYLRGFMKTSIYPTIYEVCKANLISVPNTMLIWDRDYLKSSKTFTGHNDSPEDTAYPMIYYSGPDPYGQNTKGWWFGKNGGVPSSTGPKHRADGIAQAFEKPQDPYLLNQVVMDCGVLEVTAPVDMYCKIYKIDEIPAYNDTETVTLPDEPGELIATGRAKLTPETYANTGGLVFFTLYNVEDGLECVVTPTIDCAILVAVDGYNVPEMENLTNFTAMVASNFNDDEGFGELAYLKYGIPDEDGNLVHYEWTGLNNFFRDGTMKTGFTIFLSTELPYLTFNDPREDGEYIFPREGGIMVKPLSDQVYPSDQLYPSIEFWSWTPSADAQWTLSCNGDMIPDWLTIELEDQIKEGEFSGLVNAVVSADPLPEGVEYREAIVRFEIPGDYIDYRFKQVYNSVPPPPPHFKYDMNNDGEVTIADLNTLIDLILKGYDFNVSHINILIEAILGQPIPEDIIVY